MLTIGIIREHPPERRVAQTPSTIAELLKLGSRIIVESGAGTASFFSDEDYRSAGAEVIARETVLREASIILGINPPTDWSPSGRDVYFIGMINPLNRPDNLNKLVEVGITGFALELVPRSTRAQSMDVLSSMATVAGYAAVLEAARQSPKLFPLMMTAAGSIAPAKLLILGAGVAGLQALATAKRLGAVVEVFDVRKAAKEEVLSLGGKFVDVEGAQETASAGGYAIEQSADYQQKQREAIHRHASKSDVIICTAQIPGKHAPVLIEEATIAAMKPGSVIIDLAAATGGNTALTQPDQTIERNGVRIFGPTDIVSSKPADASAMYARNVLNFIRLLIKDGKFIIPDDDDIVTATLLNRGGQIVNPRILATLQTA